jgi:hypothetical protein
MKIQPSEKTLVGEWIVQGDKVRGDATCKRIEQLITVHLKQIAVSKEWGAWEMLFQDPDDGRYWERTYPQGDRHGGGPPQLQWLSADEARRKYGDLVTVS